MSFLSLKPCRLPLLSLCVCAVASLASAKQPPPPGPLAPALQPLVDRGDLIAGAVLLVADKEKVLDLEAFGHSSLKKHTPMEVNNVFWIASMTKSITGTLFMTLVDEGKVNIEDPVEKYLPEFKGQQVVEETGKDKAKGAPHAPKHPITVKEVLSHTSGMALPNDPALRGKDTLKDLVTGYAALPLRREPGTKFEYNNAGINTAGRIIEVLTGLSFDEALHQRLLDPLGMKDTSFWPNEEQGRRLAHTVRFTADKKGLEEIDFAEKITPDLIEKLGKGVPVPHELLEDFGLGKLTEYGNHYGEPAGGLFSTAADLGRFCQMLLNGGTWEGRRYLSEKAIAQMSSIQTGDIVVNPQEGYGLGWFVKKGTAEGPAVGSYGHRGARRPIMWVDPKDGLVMVLLVERFDMTGEQQQDLYSGFMKKAVELYGKK